MVCQGKHGSSRNTMENTYGIPTGSLIWVLASHQISLNELAERPGAGHSATSGRQSSWGLDLVQGLDLEDSFLVKELSGELGVKDAASQLWKGPLSATTVWG